MKLKHHGTLRGNLLAGTIVGIAALTSPTSVFAQSTIGTGAVGTAAGDTAIGTGSIAGGTNDTADGGGAIALGQTNIASGGGTVAIGQNVTSVSSGGTTNVSIGENIDNTNGGNSLIVGSQLTSLSHDTVVLGGDATIDPASDNAFLLANDSHSAYSLATSPNSVTFLTNGNATAITNSASAVIIDTTPSTGIAYSGDTGSFIARTTTPSGVGPTLSGYANETNSVLINAAAAPGAVTDVVSIGRNSLAAANLATAVGTGATAFGIGGIAIGGDAISGANAAADDSIAIGGQSIATTAGAVALGAGSVAARAGLAGGAEKFSGALVPSTQGAVSLGAPGAERQITNVAGGTAQTDAVNVRQLSAVGNDLAGSLGGGAVFDPATGAYTAPAYTVGGQTYTNVGSALNALTAGSATAGVMYFHANSTGPDSSAIGTDSIAVGTNAVASGTNTIAIGGDANAARAANAAGPNSIAIGDAAKTTGGFATAVGLSATAQQQGSAFGEGANAGPTAIAAGFEANASGPNSTALGGTANAAGQYSLAAGTSASAFGLSSTALGNDASAVGANSVAIGGSGGTTGVNAAQALAAESVAIGMASTATNGGDVALGSNTVTTATVATPGGTIGGVATTFAGAIPKAALSVGGRQIQNVAAGQLGATSTDGVNGSQLFATNNQLGATMGAVTSVVGGTFNPVTGAYTAPAYAVGGQTYGAVGGALAAQNAIDVQYTPNALGGPTNAIDLTKGGTLGLVGVTGLANATTATGAVALAQMPLQYSTVLTPRIANPAVPSNDVTLVGAIPTTPVALHNLAAGIVSPISTDAVNGSQLYATDQLITELSGGSAGLVQQTPAATGPITVGAATGGATVGFANNAGTARTLTGVAAGMVAAGSTQAVDGGQLYGTASSVASALGGGSTVNPDGTVSAPTYNVANGTYANVGAALTALNTGIASGQLGAFVSDNTAGAGAPVATGPNASAGGFGASATGVGSTVLGNSATDNGAANAVVLGGNGSVTQMGGVALGAGSTATRAGLAGATEDFSGTAVASTQGGVSVGAPGAERQITNVAGGTAATDAVNVRQLSAVGNDLTGALGAGAAFDPATGAYTAPTYTVGGQTYGTVGAALTAENALAVQYTPDASGAATNAVDLTKGGTLAPVSLTGLAAGALDATSTDAVNGSQLYATNQTIAGLVGGTVGLVQQDPTSRAITVGATTDGATVGFANNAGTARTLTGVAAGQVANGSTQAVNGGQLYGTANSVATALGGGSVVNADGTVSAPTYSVGGANYASVGGAVTALDTTTVKYDVVPATGARAQSITLTGGDPNEPVVIHNVAAGTARTDASNVGQVQDAQAAANAYTNQQVAGVQNQMSGINTQLANLESNINETRDEARSAAAVGLAAASLRFDDRPGKFSVAAGGGYWRGETAGAFGVGYTLPDGHFRLNATAATSGSNVGIGAGATYTFN